MNVSVCQGVRNGMGRYIRRRYSVAPRKGVNGSSVGLCVLRINIEEADIFGQRETVS